jgi:hypothetical protein
VALAVYWRYVPPLHVERRDTDNSRANKGPSFRLFRVNEKIIFADNRLEPREKEFFVDTRENSSLTKSDQNRNVAAR